MRRKGNTVGMIIAGIGIFIILALILPKKFWLFLVGVVITAVGIHICKK